MAEGKYGEVLYERANLKVRSLILLSSGDGFALRDLCKPRHDRCGIAMQDLRARFLADLRFRKRLASPLAAEFGSIGAAHDTLGAVQAHRALAAGSDFCFLTIFAANQSTNLVGRHGVGHNKMDWAAEKRGSLSTETLN